MKAAFREIAVTTLRHFSLPKHHLSNISFLRSQEKSMVEKCHESTHGQKHTPRQETLR